jgi:hypothetical protein
MFDVAGLTSPDKSNFKHQTPNIRKNSLYLRNPLNPRSIQLTKEIFGAFKKASMQRSIFFAT